MENEVEEEDHHSGVSMSLINKSRIDVTVNSFDRAGSIVVPGINNKEKEEEKSEQTLANDNFIKEMNQLISYINEQLIFYSDLCLGRNYIWKKSLETIFPIQFVFNQIYNKKIFKGIY